MILNRAVLSTPTQYPKVVGLRYDPAKLTEGIVHIGVGNFARAFLFMRLNDLMNHDDLIIRQQALEWGVAGVNLFPLAGEPDLFGEKLTEQDNLYTVLECGNEGHMGHIVGVVKSYLHAPSDPNAVVEKLSQENIRIVSLTVTEGGYYCDEETGALNKDHPAICEALENKGDPVIWLEFIMAAVRNRMGNGGAGPFTVWSCDNVQHNGDVAKDVLLEFIRERREYGIANWVETHVRFPNSMVDRITPATVQKHRDKIAEDGLVDEVPVPTEVFSRLVMTDNFAIASNGRPGCPSLKDMGAHVVTDVTEWECMKLRMLNGSHSQMSYLGVLAGLDYVHEAALDPDLRAVLQATLRHEVQPPLPEIDGLNFDEEAGRILSRFENSSNPDGLLRICSDASGKIPKFILSSVRAQLRPHGDGRVKFLALGIAGWFKYLRDKQVSSFDDKNDTVKALHTLALKSGYDADGKISRANMVQTLLDERHIFGADLPKNEIFKNALLEALNLLDNDVRETLRSYAEEGTKNLVG